MSKYLSTREACEYLGIKNRKTLYVYIQEGKLRARKLGGDDKDNRHWRFTIEDLEAFIRGDTPAGVGSEHGEQRKNAVSSGR